MKRLLSILAVVLSIATAQSQTTYFEWLHKIGDSGSDNIGQITTDDAGNVYIVGSFTGEIILGQDTLNSISLTEASPFVAKYSAAGMLQWGKKLSTNVTSGPVIEYTWTKIKTSPNGRIAVTGQKNCNGATYAFFSLIRDDGTIVTVNDQTTYQKPTNVDFDSTDNAYIVGNNSGAGSYIIKFDSTGAILWDLLYNTQNRLFDIVYYNGTVSVTGQYQAQMQLTDEMGSTPITLNATSGLNDWDFFLAKYSPDGHLLSGTTSAGLTTGAAGPFQNFASEFSPNSVWQIMWTDNTSNEIKLRKYSTAFVPGATTTVTTTVCGFPPLVSQAISSNGNQTVFTYSGLVCTIGPGYLLNTTGGVDKVFDIPPAGNSSSNDVFIRRFSFAPDGSIYMLGEFKGNFLYRDNTGAHTFSSNQGSSDIYVSKLYFCPDFTYNITVHGDSIDCDLQGLNYQWMKNDVLIPGATNSSYIATQTGSYGVIVSNSYGCADTSYSYGIVIDAVEELERNSFNVYPNPVTSTIHFSKAEMGVKVSLFNMLGIRVFEGAISSENTINVSTLAPGIYLIRVGLNQQIIIKS